MKKALIAILLVAAVIGAAIMVYKVKNSDAFTAVDRLASIDKTVPSVSWKVKSAGIDFVQQTWTDPEGRICTVTISNKTGMSSPDCDFRPLPVKF